jgi:hypothetical protein
VAPRVGIEPIQKNGVFRGEKDLQNRAGSLIGSPSKKLDKELKQILRIWPKLKKRHKAALLSLINVFGKEGV